MKEQRWPGDYQTKEEQFDSSLRQERMGMAEINKDFGNDYLALGDMPHLDRYETYELEPSITTQLDVVGRQPHAREYLEYQLNNSRSHRKFEMFEGQSVDYCEGIQFSGTP